MPIPNDSDFIASGVTEGGFKTALAVLLSNLRTLLGTTGLAADARAALGLNGAPIAYNSRGPWATGQMYGVNDVVVQASVVYVGQVTHTAGVFATDLAAGYWTVLQGITADVLAATNGDDLVGHGAGTVKSRFAELPTLKDFLATGNGAADDTSQVSAALAAALRVWASAGDYLVTTPSNDLGREVDGPGRLVRSIAGGRQQLNLSADQHQHVFGQEYLYAFHTAIAGQMGGAAATAVMSGDSTTYGAGGNGATAPFLIHQLVAALGKEAGFKVNVLNHGHPGSNTFQWRTGGYLADDLAATPDLLVLRWGINDPGWLKNNTTPPLDAGQSYPNRRDIADFAYDLRLGLQTIRASRSVASLSILLMTPNSTSDTPNGRDEIWYEQVRRVVRKAARDFQCACIDTYAIWNDSRVSADLWMDNPFGDGRAIHPHNVMNSWISSAIADLLFPRGLRLSFFPGELGLQTSAANPNDFKIGLNLARTDPATFPGTIDGSVLTIRTADEFAMQLAWSGADATMMPSVRFGAGGAWFNWLSRVPADLIPQNGWVVNSSGQEVRASISWKIVTVSGTVKSGTMAAGTLVATLPAGFRPYSTQYFTVPCGAGAAFSQLAVLQVNSDGTIKIMACPANGGLSFSGISFEAYA